MKKIYIPKKQIKPVTYPISAAGRKNPLRRAFCCKCNGGPRRAEIIYVEYFPIACCPCAAIKQPKALNQGPAGENTRCQFVRLRTALFRYCNVPLQQTLRNQCNIGRYFSVPNPGKKPQLLLAKAQINGRQWAKLTVGRCGNAPGPTLDTRHSPGIQSRIAQKRPTAGQKQLRKPGKADEQPFSAY